MHFIVQKAHTPEAVLNDPMAAQILAQARKSLEAETIVNNLLDLRAIFGEDLPAHAGFHSELLGKFRELMLDPRVTTSSQIVA